MTRSLVLLCALSFSAGAQTLQESITVDVVEVPVHVTRRGKAVTGLTRDMFELYVNGKLQPFEYFDVIDSRGPEWRTGNPACPDGQDCPSSTAPPLERRNLTVLLFDTAATSHLYLGRASEAAQKFVAEAPASEAFAVARLDAGGVRFLVPFTMDRPSVLRACRTLRPSRAGDALGLATLETERVATAGRAALGGMLSFDDAVLDDIGPAMAGTSQEAQAAAKALQENVTKQLRADSEIRTAKHLGLLAENLAPINGVKHVILFAEGSRRAAHPVTAAAMHDKFQAAGVILDAVELDNMRVDGLVDVGRRAESSIWAPPASKILEDRSEPLYTLSLATGGTVAKHKDIIDGLRFLREIQGVTYILGFRPPQTGQTENEISVKVTKQPLGTNVTYRRGYSTGPAVGRNEGLFLADVMLNDIPQRGLTVNLSVAPDKSATKVLVSVPGQELLAREVGGSQTEVDVYLYIFNEQDLVAAWGYWRLNIDLEKGREYLASNAYEIQRLFALRPGTFSAKALLRFPNTDVTGFQRADFEVAAR